MTTLYTLNLHIPCIEVSSTSHKVPIFFLWWESFTPIGNVGVLHVRTLIKWILILHASDKRFQIVHLSICYVSLSSLIISVQQIVLLLQCDIIYLEGAWENRDFSL